MEFEWVGGIIVLIGFAGKARVGKDTATQYLVENYRFNRIGLADAVKQGSYNLNPWICVTEEEYDAYIYPHRVEDLWNHAFEYSGGLLYFIKLQKLVEHLGIETAKKIKEVREFYQKYGTEGGRNIHGDQCWLDIAKRKFTGKDAISDVRFANEAEFVRESGGIVINLIRDNAEAVNAHASENGLCSEYYDILLENNGTKEELFAKIDKIYNDSI